MTKLPLIERFISFFSPRLAYKRLVVQDAIRAYDGAARTRRTANWRAPSTSARAEGKGQLQILRNRARDLVRNNPYAKRGINLIATNTVGTGIIPSINGVSDAQEKSIAEKWREWGETKACDFDNKHDFYGLQRLVMRSVAESGEVIIRRRIDSDADNPIKLQVLESDHIVTSLNTGRIKQGIEFDEKGKIAFYHLYQEHPGNNDTSLRSAFTTVKVPANEIQHIFQTDRPGQLRGITWLAAALIRLRDIDDYEHTQLIRQKIAACFAAFVHDIEQPDTESVPDEDLVEKLEPGIIETLPPGKDIKFGDPPSVDNFKEYMSVSLRAIATALGVSYEALTGDLSEVNFSSARMGWLEFGRNIDEWRSVLMNPDFNKPMFEWFLLGLQLTGVNTAGISATWTPPKREMVDPTKELPAKIKSIRSGITTLSETIREQGRDPEQVFAELKSDKEKIDELGLILDSDPSKTASDGDIQPTETASEGVSNEEQG